MLSKAALQSFIGGWGTFGWGGQESSSLASTDRASEGQKGRARPRGGGNPAVLSALGLSFPWAPGQGEGPPQPRAPPGFSRTRACPLRGGPAQSQPQPWPPPAGSPGGPQRPRGPDPLGCAARVTWTRGSLGRAGGLGALCEPQVVRGAEPGPSRGASGAGRPAGARLSEPIKPPPAPSTSPARPRAVATPRRGRLALLN